MSTSLVPQPELAEPLNLWYIELDCTEALEILDLLTLTAHSDPQMNARRRAMADRLFNRINEA